MRRSARRCSPRSRPICITGRPWPAKSSRRHPGDETALFYLGKLDLNYVWLQLGLLGKKTGWDEYWEARKSLDAVLKANPKHVRARVARGWIDFIVNTRMPWGTRWVLGGGNKKKGLAAVREGAEMATDTFSHAEAEFALWDMLRARQEHSRGHRSRETDRPGVSGKHRSRHVPEGAVADKPAIVRDRR